MTVVNSNQKWDEFVDSVPGAHILQTASWGVFKSYYGWQPIHLIEENCGAQVLFRNLPLGFSIAYIPKGPLGTQWDQLWSELDGICEKKHAIMLIVEPNLWEPLENDNTLRLHDTFHVQEHTIQPRRTLMVDLKGDEETILAGMKQKTRYNIRLAQKKDIVISQTDDLESFYKIMRITGSRDGFALHEKSYYQRVYNLFAPLGQCALLHASYENKVLASLMVFAYQQQAWYFYGASSDEERNRMPTYLLQWEAMRWAKSKGCTSYDLWGVPDTDEDTLEAQFSDRSNELWGVYRFKRGFGGKLLRSAPAYVKVYHPLLYRLIAHRTGMQAG